MIRLAVAGNPHFECCVLEQTRPGKSFSVETVTSFREVYPGDLDLYFIVGQDAFQAIQTWKDWERLLGLCHFIVMTRPGYEQKDLRGILPASLSESYLYDGSQCGFRGISGHVIYFREVTLLDISSSLIRNRAARGFSITYLIPASVERYILDQTLYR